MRSKQKKPEKASSGYRHYTREQLIRGIALVTQGVSAYKAAKMTGVPQSTLKDRRSGAIPVDRFNSDNPLFDTNEEQMLADHILEMSTYGYGYTRKEVLLLASDFGHFINKLSSERTLSETWLYVGFLKRHPEIVFSKAHSLSMSRAKSVTPDVINNYFLRLQMLIDKYNLAGKPQNIYNVDETGFSPEHCAPKLATKRGETPQSVTSPRSCMVTCIGGCNALGNSVPPFLVFQGAKMREDLKENCTAGCGFEITKNGWSNSLIFTTYIEKHFSKYLQRSSTDEHILLLYDGSTTHLNPGLIEWAKSHNIILFVLPPHTSHFLQPCDVGCFGPLKRAYSSYCHTFMRTHPGQVINRYNIGELICKSYITAMTPKNILSAFKKTGISPFNPQSISGKVVKPSEAVRNNDSVVVDNENVVVGSEENPDHESSKVTNSSKGKKMLNDRLPKNNTSVTNKGPNNGKKRVSIGGMAITEGEGYEVLCSKDKSKDTSEKSQKRKTSVKSVKNAKVICLEDKNVVVNDSSDDDVVSESCVLPSNYTSKRGRKVTKKVNWSPQPGPSRIYVNSEHVDSSQDDDTELRNPCCVCGKENVSMRKMSYIKIVEWAQCSNIACEHWVHLEFCVPERRVNKNDLFYCPCCRTVRESET